MDDNFLSIVSNFARSVNLASNFFFVRQFGGIIPRSLATRADGTFDVNELLHIYRDGSNYHHPTPRLVAVENPINGKVLPLSFMQEVRMPISTVVSHSTHRIKSRFMTLREA